MVFAAVWKRVIAYLVDWLIVNSIIISPLNSLLKEIFPSDLKNLLVFLNSNNFSNILLLSIVIGVISIMYWTILEYKIQQTLGCLLLNIRVKSEKKGVKFSQAFLRNITKISGVLLIIDSIFILSSKKKQRLTEKLSKTLTVTGT